jgi:BolA family transcriptional regulator, general stress-responsive regulator
MAVAQTIREKLTAAFAPSDLTVSDESAHHAGHAGHRPGGETHFDVRIVSEKFSGLSRVERQRRIYAALDAEFRAGLHALSLKALTPSEAAR